MSTDVSVDVNWCVKEFQVSSRWSSSEVTWVWVIIAIEVSFYKYRSYKDSPPPLWILMCCVTFLCKPICVLGWGQDPPFCRWLSSCLTPRSWPQAWAPTPYGQGSRLASATGFKQKDNWVRKEKVTENSKWKTAKHEYTMVWFLAVLLVPLWSMAFFVNIDTFLRWGY